MNSGRELLYDSRRTFITAFQCYVFSLLLFFFSFFHLGCSSNTRIALHQENELSEGRVHVEGRFIGQAASIPCDIDLKCGPVYLITWSKKDSTKEWGRVFLFSESYQTALGDFSADDGDRVKVDMSNVTSLVIKNFLSKDEGLYKCDVTYVQGSCPSLTFTQLVLLVTPGEPLLRVNGKNLDGLVGNRTTILSSSGREGGEEESPSDTIRLGPLDEGSTVVLDCSSSGGRPIPDVKWYDKDEVMKGKISVSADPEGAGSTVTSTVRFTANRKHLNSIFSCNVGNNATSHPLVKSVIFDIRVKPLSLKIQGPVTPVVAGEMVTLTCSVEGSRPPASIDWFNRSELVEPQPVISEEMMEDGTFRTSSSLIFMASSYDDREFSCMGTNQVLKERNEVPLLESLRLKVLFAPICKVRLLPKDKSDQLKMECRATSSPPITSFKWIRYNETIMSIESDDQESMEQSSIFLAPESNVESYNCVAQNMMGSSTCTLQTKQIEVSAMVGQQASIPCEVDSKCSPFQITWSRNISNDWREIPSPIMEGGKAILHSPLANTSFLESLPVRLNIRKASLGDEGTYKCHIAYLHPSCPSVTYVRLHVTDPPKPPRLKIKGILSDSMQISWEVEPNLSSAVTSHEIGIGKKGKEIFSEENKLAGFILNYKRDVESDHEDWKSIRLARHQRMYSLKNENLFCGSPYVVKMTPFNNEVGLGESSEEVRFTTPGHPPVAPLDSSSFVQSNKTSATLNLKSWNDGGCPISTFEIRIKQRSQKQWLILSNNTKPQDEVVTIHDLQPSTRYDLLVLAKNDAGRTESSIVFSTITSSGGTSAPKLLSDQILAKTTFDSMIVIPSIFAAILLIVGGVVGYSFLCKRRRFNVDNQSDIYGRQPHDKLSLNSFPKTPSKGVTGSAAGFSVPSPLIGEAAEHIYQQPTRTTQIYYPSVINIRPDGSPLLSDYVTEGSDSPTSTSSSIQHFYERPAVDLSRERSTPLHHSLHHLNIPVNTPRLPSQRMQTLHPHPLHRLQQHHLQREQQLHESLLQRPALSSSTHQPSFHYAQNHHTLYRSLRRETRNSRP